MAGHLFSLPSAPAWGLVQRPGLVRGIAGRLVGSCFQLMLVPQARPLCACLGMLWELSPAPRALALPHCPALLCHRPPCFALGLIFRVVMAVVLAYLGHVVQLLTWGGGWLWKPGPALGELLTPILT